MNRLNLIPKPRQAAASRGRRVRRWIIALGAYSVLVGVFCLAQIPNLASADSGLSQRLESLEATITQTEARNKTLQQRVQSASRSLEAHRAVALHPDWSRMLTILADKRGESVLLERVEIAPRYPVDDPRAPRPRRATKGEPVVPERPPTIVGYVLKVSGVAPAPKSVSEFVLDLESTRLFERVDQRDVKARKVRGVDGVSFVLECSLNEGMVKP